MNRQEEFNLRLQRIAKHTGHTNATLFIGVDEALPGAALQRRSPRPRSLGRAWAQVVLGMTSGALGWIWAQWLSASLITGLSPLLLALAELALALTAVGLLRAILGLRGARLLALQVLAMLLTAALLHNLVQATPQLFAGIFPPAWLAAMQGVAPVAVLPGITPHL